ncbi:MAG: cell division control protein Cdc6, partial [Candidatus Aenigmatarchaeota archaeon]
MQEKLRTFFSDYKDKESIFIDKKLLTPNYIPEQILHRDEQISSIARILAPSLHMEQPSNIFI